MQISVRTRDISNIHGNLSAEIRNLSNRRVLIISFHIVIHARLLIFLNYPTRNKFHGYLTIILVLDQR